MATKATPAQYLAVGVQSCAFRNLAGQPSSVRIAKDDLIPAPRLVGVALARMPERSCQMAYETLIVEIEDYVALIRLNRPDALNALNAKLMDELADALRSADKNDKVRCVIITGSEKAFAAGADIKEMSEKSFVDAFTEDFFADATEAIARFRKPIIAAVSGYALGGGCELAMMCDFILAADTAKFGQPEINLGVVAGIGGTQRLTRFVGKSKSMEMHLTGRFMDAAEAERSGLVSRVVPANKLISEAMNTARKITEKSALAVMMAKEAVNRSYETTLSEGILYERRVFHALFATEDQKEGMHAFLEKREPQFRDK
jgi:enoyl-CoA hydratase